MGHSLLHITTALDFMRQRITTYEEEAHKFSDYSVRASLVISHLPGLKQQEHGAAVQNTTVTQLPPYTAHSRGHLKEVLHSPPLDSMCKDF